MTADFTISRVSEPATSDWPEVLSCCEYWRIRGVDEVTPAETAHGFLAEYREVARREIAATRRSALRGANRASGAPPIDE